MKPSTNDTDVQYFNTAKQFQEGELACVSTELDDKFLDMTMKDKSGWVKSVNKLIDKTMMNETATLKIKKEMILKLKIDNMRTKHFAHNWSTAGRT